MEGDVDLDSWSEEELEVVDADRGLEPERERKTCCNGICDEDIYHEENKDISERM